MDNEYWGQQFEKGKPPSNVPPVPPDHVTGDTSTARPVSELDFVGAVFSPDEVIDPEEARPANCEHGPLYAYIRLQGNYGLGCAKYQAILLRGAYRAEAELAAWAYFGMCKVAISCFSG